MAEGYDYVNVLDIKLVEIRKTTISLVSPTRNVNSYTFLIVDAVSPNPVYAVAVASGHILGGNNEIKKLNAFAENFILSSMKEEPAWKQQRKMLVIDLDNFPYIRSYFDYRDQRVHLDDGSQFSKDIIKLWSEQTPEMIPTIVVNTEIPYTELKLIPTTHMDKQ